MIDLTRRNFLWLMAIGLVSYRCGGGDEGGGGNSNTPANSPVKFNDMKLLSAELVGGQWQSTIGLPTNRILGAKDKPTVKWNRDGVDKNWIFQGDKYF